MYLKITTDHPFIKAMEREPSMSKGDIAEMLYHEVYHEKGKNWPIFLAEVMTWKNGITVELQFKKQLRAAWEPVNSRMSLPFELARLIQNDIGVIRNRIENEQSEARTKGREAKNK